MGIGISDGAVVGRATGVCDGAVVGTDIGETEGAIVGEDSGASDGATVGEDNGVSDGVVVGGTIGAYDGAAVGVSDGAVVGGAIGPSEGAAVGASDGGAAMFEIKVYAARKSGRGPMRPVSPSGCGCPVNTMICTRRILGFLFMKQHSNLPHASLSDLAVDPRCLWPSLVCSLQHQQL